jgi:hypothetical protein
LFDFDIFKTKINALTLLFPRSWLITVFVTRLTRLVSLVEQELKTHPELLSSLPIFSGFRVTRSLVLYVCFVDRCWSFCTCSFGHCVVCSSLIYGFWLPPGIFKLFLRSVNAISSRWSWIYKVEAHQISNRKNAFLSNPF